MNFETENNLLVKTIYKLVEISDCFITGDKKNAQLFMKTSQGAIKLADGSLTKMDPDTPVYTTSAFSACIYSAIADCIYWFRNTLSSLEPKDKKTPDEKIKAILKTKEVPAQPAQPVEETPVEETSVEKTPAEAPVEEEPAPEAEETPVEETPAEATGAED